MGIITAAKSSVGPKNQNKLYWRQTHYKGQPKYPFVKIDGSIGHYKVQISPGNYSASEDFILNLDYDD